MARQLLRGWQSDLNILLFVKQIRKRSVFASATIIGFQILAVQHSPNRYKRGKQKGSLSWWRERHEPNHSNCRAETQQQVLQSRAPDGVGRPGVLIFLSEEISRI